MDSRINPDKKKRGRAENLEASLPMRFHIFGDSHFHLYTPIANVVPHFRVAMTMHRVGRDGIAALDPLSTISNGELLGFIFGEIDIRVHIAQQRDRSGRSPQGILDDLVRAYINTLQQMQLLYPLSKLIVFSVVPPAGIDHPSFDHFYPRNGTDEERVSWTIGLNNRLREQAGIYNWGFVDQYTPFIDDRGLLDINISDDGVHVRQGSHPSVDLRTATGIIAYSENPATLRNAYEGLVIAERVKSALVINALHKSIAELKAMHAQDLRQLQNSLDHVATVHQRMVEEARMAAIQSNELAEVKALASVRAHAEQIEAARRRNEFGLTLFGWSLKFNARLTRLKL